MIAIWVPPCGSPRDPDALTIRAGEARVLLAIVGEDHRVAQRLERQFIESSAAGEIRDPNTYMIDH
jgi:hypothetical protein